jgi:hypothetical protein
MLDDYCRSVVDRNPSMAIPWVLMAAFLYYHRDETIISDGLYDHLAGLVKARWEHLEHPHKHLLSGMRGEKHYSLFHMREQDYPLRTRGGAVSALGLLRDPAKLKMAANL